MELVSAFSRRRDLSMLHAFFCAVTCCLGKSLSHYLSLHLLFLLFCEKPCSHFWGKAIQIQRLPKKHQELQPFSPSAISQLPNFQKNPRTWRPKTCRQRNGHTALDLLHLWLRSRLENLSRVNRAIRAKPQEFFFLFFKRLVRKWRNISRNRCFFLLGCFLVVSIWLEHVEISLKHPFICGALKWQRRNLPELFFKHQLNSTRIQVVTIPSITR